MSVNILSLATACSLIFASLLVAGCNTAQQRTAACTGSEQPTSRLFLQQVTDHSAIIKWRGEAEAVCAGPDIQHLNIRVEATDEGSHKLAKLTGLKADTTYFYSVGGAGAGDQARQFHTAPAPGELPADGNTHIWLLGDSGTQTEHFMGHFNHLGEALQVKAGFFEYNRKHAGNEPLDLLLLLGDNAYLEGTDDQWQAAFFDIYPEVLRHTATWTTIGNHEMGAAPIDVCLLATLPACTNGPLVMALGGISNSSDPASYSSDGKAADGSGPPYLDIFTLPAGAEAGGVASGTEQYYSFDYANVHIVSLDSQLSNRDPAQREVMRDWLVDDLSNNALDWTVVIFHHPVYSKGENHDSDLEQAEIDMRQTFAPVFDGYGVDVVYNGHSHSYERSWYLHGHYGPSTSFDASVHAQLNARGEPALGQGDESYHQISPTSGSDDRSVYTVAGSSGKADSHKPCPEGQALGCTLPDWLMHPAHRSFSGPAPDVRPNGLARKGSVVLDITRTTLTSRFVDEHGEVLDYFTITRE
jgi:Calcineurin-like phosphoesterase